MVYEFWQLPPSVRRAITDELGLNEKADQDVAETERYRRAFLRARERGLVSELNEAINRHTDCLTTQ